MFVGITKDNDTLIIKAITGSHVVRYALHQPYIISGKRGRDDIKTVDEIIDNVYMWDDVYSHDEIVRLGNLTTHDFAILASRASTRRAYDVLDACPNCSKNDFAVVLQFDGSATIEDGEFKVWRKMNAPRVQRAICKECGCTETAWS